MRSFFLTILIIILTLPSYALEIYYPSKTNIQKNTKTTFFIGKANPTHPLTVNGQIVKLHSTGGFAHFVELADDTNVFTFKNENNVLTYTISKNIDQPNLVTPNEFKKFLLPKNAKVINLTPLRTTPIDFGMNRLSHLPPETQLKIDGEKGNFYRVFLTDNNFAWVNKKDIKFTDTTPASIKRMKSRKSRNFITYKFKTDKKLPFIIEEKNGLTLTFYNVSNAENETYIFKDNTNKQLFGYSGEYDKNNNFVLKIRNKPKLGKFSPLKNLTIAIDAGHGGKDSGAIGCLGTKEKDVNLKIANHLANELKNLGAKVIMIRTKDTYLGLYERIELANKKNVIIFLSLHNNALPDTKNPLNYRGTSVFYYHPQSKQLAQHILNSITTTTTLPNDGLHQQSFAVIRNTNALSALIEFAYLINPEDNALIIKDTFQQLCAKAVAQGILNWLTELKEQKL